MNKIKKYIKPIIYFYILLLSYLIIITTLNSFDLIGYKTVSIISFIITIIMYMSLGFMAALKSEKKGYINGLIVGGFNVILFLFLAVLLETHPKLNIGIYFLILLLSSTIGGMFGINYKNIKIK